LWASEKVFYWDELLYLSLPTVMIIFGKDQLSWAILSVTYAKWTYIFVTSQLLFGLHFFNRGHHATNLVHQNDKIKSFDFGEYQISTTVDRSEPQSNYFSSIAYFGDQVLHHLFPSIDSSIYPQLRDTLTSTCKQFDVEVKPQITIMRAMFEQFKQLFRTETL
jgi:fatty acid desaturase